MFLLLKNLYNKILYSPYFTYLVKDIQPGDFYSSCDGTPCLCYDIIEDYIDGVNGISIIDGQPKNCNFWHCAPYYLSYEDAMEQRDYILEHGFEKFKVESKYRTINYTYEILAKYCKNSLKFRIKNIIQQLRRQHNYNMHITYAKKENDQEYLQSTLNYIKQIRKILFNFK